MNGVRNPKGEKNNFVPVLNYKILSIVKGPSKLFHPMGGALQYSQPVNFLVRFFLTEKMNNTIILSLDFLFVF